jgi:phage terminase large subunit-like protein
MAMLGLRIGRNPQCMISTTPKPIPLIRELLRMDTCVKTVATTYDNVPNLAPSFFDRIIKRYEGTRLGRQELSGQLIEETEGALWTRDMVEAARWPTGKPLPDMRRVVVSIDPAVTENPTSNLTGIVVAGRGADNRGYVLEDLSGRYSPDMWARTAVHAFDDYSADRIVAEGNQGGDMVRHTLSTVRKDLPISIVHASQSKQARAEPVSALYEQRKVSHAKPFAELEDQLCTWEPLSGDESPDRLDALVWAMTDLFLRAHEPVRFPGAFVVQRPRNIPGQ